MCVCEWLVCKLVETTVLGGLLTLNETYRAVESLIQQSRHKLSTLVLLLNRTFQLLKIYRQGKGGFNSLTIEAVLRELGCITY